VWITVELYENRLKGGDEAPHEINLGVERIARSTAKPGSQSAGRV